MGRCREWVALTLIVVCILGSLPAAVAHRDAANETRVFVADDPDPAAGSVPPFVPIGPTADRNTSVTLANASQQRDFDYRTTDPAVTVGPSNQTVQSYQRARLAAIDTNQSTSRWPAHAPEPKDGVVVEDAHITFMGGSGARLQTTNGTEPMLLPKRGEIHTLLDYRLPTATEQCTTRDGARRCVSYDVLNTTVVRRLAIGDQQWVSRGRSNRTIAYRNVMATDTTTMRVSATVTVRVERTTRVIGNSSTDLVETARNVSTHSVTVSDTRRVAITTNQPADVRQRVITTPDGDRTVVLTFQGPPNATERRLWSTAQVGNATLHNVWGAYSARQSRNATLATRTGERPVDLPHPLGMYLTAVRDAPTLERSTQQLNDGEYPKLADRQASPGATQPAALGPRVNVSTAPASYPTRIVIEDVSAPVTNLTDVHGDPIPVTTTHHERHAATLTLTHVNASHARLRLTATASGEPLPNRTVSLAHAARETVTTSAEGTAIVQRRGTHVRASFPGTNVSASHSEYYSPASAAVTFAPTFSIYTVIASLSGALVSVAGIIVLLLPLHFLRR